MKGYMYILECAGGSFYTGSTNDLDLRLTQHQAGEGANYTRKRLPVNVVYFEEFQKIDEAFYREKQVQGWSRKKKEALINGEFDRLTHLSKNYTQYPQTVASTSSATADTTHDNNENTAISVASASSATTRTEAIADLEHEDNEDAITPVAEPVEATTVPSSLLPSTGSGNTKKY